MAKIKITADTKDAQTKVKKLKADVLDLQKTAQKRTALNINSDNSRRYTNTETYRSASKGTKTRSTASESSTRAVKGKTEGYGAAIVGGVAGGVAGLVLNNIPLLVSMVGKAVDAMTFGATNFQGLGETIRKYMELGDAFSNPARGALSRGDSLDALDDERRANKSDTLGDEVAWREAFANQTGTNADQLLQRSQSIFDMATSGNIEEMEKAWKILSPTGLSFSDLQNNSIWENLLKLIEAYHKAGEDGINELEPVMQEIFGRRGMVALRKAGDGSAIRENFTTLRKTYSEYVEPNEKAILEATEKAEVTRSQAKIIDLGMPAGSERFITQGAKDIYDISKIKYDLYGAGRDAIVNQVTPSETEAVATAIEEGFNRVEPKDLRPLYTPAKEPEYEGLFHWDEKRLPNGNIQYKSFDPKGQFMRMWENGFSANTSNPEMNQSMKDVVNELKRNTTATGQMTEAMRQMGGSSSARFV